MSLSVVEPGAARAETAPVADPAPLAQRIADTFFSPAKVFASFGRSEAAPWLGPVLVCAALGAAVTVASTFLVPPEVMAEFTLEQMAARGATELPSVSEMTAQMEGMRAVSLAMGAVGMVLWSFVRVALVAGLLWVLFSVATGGQATFRQYAAVASHTFVVGTVGLVLVSALQIYTRRLDLALDLALLAPGLDAASLPHALLKSLGVFKVWMIALLAVGVSAVSRKRMTAVAFAVLLALNLALAAATALVMGAAFGG